MSTKHWIEIAFPGEDNEKRIRDHESIIKFVERYIELFDSGRDPHIEKNITIVPAEYPLRDVLLGDLNAAQSTRPTQGRGTRIAITIDGKMNAAIINDMDILIHGSVPKIYTPHL